MRITTLPNCPIEELLGFALARPFERLESAIPRRIAFKDRDGHVAHPQDVMDSINAAQEDMLYLGRAAVINRVHWVKEKGANVCCLQCK